jgi:hypothetical protein
VRKVIERSLSSRRFVVVVDGLADVTERIMKTRQSALLGF